MFEKFTRADARDFSTRYQGTFGFFRNNAEKKAPWLAKLTFVDDQIIFVDKNSIEYRLNPDLQEDVGFEFLPPRSVFYNTVEGAVYVERVATRQFQRGISDRNTKLYLLKKGFTPAQVNFKWLGMIYDNKVNRGEAYEKYVTQAIPSFSPAPAFAVDASFVYCFGTKCGVVKSFTKTEIKVKLDDPMLFRTEISDAFKGITKVEFEQ